MFKGYNKVYIYGFGFCLIDVQKLIIDRCIVWEGSISMKFLYAHD